MGSILTRYDGELREPLMWRLGSQISMRIARAKEQAAGVWAAPGKSGLHARGEGERAASRESSLLFRLERGPGIALQAKQEKKALSSRGRGYKDELKPSELICSIVWANNKLNSTILAIAALHQVGPLALGEVPVP